MSPRASRNCETGSSSHHTATDLDASCRRDTQATDCDDDEDSVSNLEEMHGKQLLFTAAEATKK